MSITLLAFSNFLAACGHSAGNFLGKAVPYPRFCPKGLNLTHNSSPLPFSGQIFSPGVSGLRREKMLMRNLGRVSPG
jgi:hypothetical protein